MSSYLIFVCDGAGISYYVYSFCWFPVSASVGRGMILVSFIML